MKVQKYLAYALMFITVSLVAQENKMSESYRLYQSARNFQSQDQLYEAIERYRLALQQNPHYGLAYQGLAECFYALNEYDEAFSHASKAQQYMPKNNYLLNLQAFSLIGLQKPQEARKLFTHVLKDFPNDVEARFGLAEIDIADGRITDATELYEAALARQSESRKALLSLAFLSYEQEKVALANTYIQKALRYHGDNAQVHFFAGYLASMEKNYPLAEIRLNTALALKPRYPQALSLLSVVLYAQKKYTEAIAICDERIRNNRNQQDAWYVKALSLMQQKKPTLALETAKTGLSLNDANEMMRLLLETLSMEILNYEDPYRKELAFFHQQKGEGFARRNMSKQALFEYRTALKLNPYNAPVREAYAKLLLRFGYPERYLEELQFLQSIGKSNPSVNDAIEAYQKNYAYSIKNRWKVDSLYMDKAHLSFAFFYTEDAMPLFYPDSSRLTANLLSQSLVYNRRFAISSYTDTPSDYIIAFKTARDLKTDYFMLFSLAEHERDVTMHLDLYATSSGSHIYRFTVYRSGNDAYAQAVRRLTQMVDNTIPLVGAIINRYQNEAIIDIGSRDADLKDKVFDVVAKGGVHVNKESLGVHYEPQDLLGTFTVTKTSEEVSEGLLKRNGYYDRMTKGDIVLLVEKDISKEKEQKDPSTVSMERAPLLSLLRSIN